MPDLTDFMKAVKTKKTLPVALNLLKDELILAKVHEDGNKAILLAARKNAWTVVQELLKIKKVQENINARDKKFYDRTLLHQAIAAGRVEIAKNIIAHGGDLGMLDDTELSTLHLAVSSGKAEMIELILKHSDNVTQTDMIGRNALHMAAEDEEEDDCLLVLLNDPRFKHLINDKDYFGEIPLMLAHRLHNENAIKFLSDAIDDPQAVLESSTYYQRPDLSQKTIISQLKRYLKLWLNNLTQEDITTLEATMLTEVERKNLTTEECLQVAVERKKHDIDLIMPEKGMCNGIEFLAQIYLSMYGPDEYDEIVKAICEWDGQPDSLDKSFLSPKLREKYKNLKEIFLEFSDHIIFLQHSPGKHISDLNLYLTQKNRIEQWNIIAPSTPTLFLKKISDYYKVESFTKEQLTEFLAIFSRFPNSFLEVYHDNTQDKKAHVISLKFLPTEYNELSALYVDPNWPTGGPICFDSIDKLANFIYQKSFADFGNMGEFPTEFALYKFFKKSNEIADPELPVPVDSWSFNPSPNKLNELHHLVIENDFEKFKEMINKNDALIRANFLTPDAHKKTPLDWAIQFDRVEVVKALLPIFTDECKTNSLLDPELLLKTLISINRKYKDITENEILLLLNLPIIKEHADFNKNELLSSALKNKQVKLVAKLLDLENVCLMAPKMREWNVISQFNKFKNRSTPFVKEPVRAQPLSWSKMEQKKTQMYDEENKKNLDEKHNNPKI